MGDKLTLSPTGDPDGSSFTTSLNDSLTKIANEFDKVLYQDGSESLNGTLNANSNHIVNLPAPAGPTEPLRLADIPSALKGDKGDPGANLGSIGTFLNAYTATIPVGVDLVSTSGFAVNGYGASNYIYDSSINASYVTANPTTSFISANGRGFRLAPDDYVARRLTYGVRLVPRNYREVMAELSSISTNLNGFAKYAGTTGGDGKPVYYVNNPSLDPGTMYSLGWAIDQSQTGGGGNIVFDSLGDFSIDLPDRLIFTNFNNITVWAPGRNVTIWCDRLKGALNFSNSSNFIFKNIGVRPRPGPINGTAVGENVSNAKTLVAIDSSTTDKFAFVSCDIRHPSWHCLDVTRNTPYTDSHQCRFSVQNCIFRDAIQCHLIGTDNATFGAGDYTTNSSAREVFGTFHQCVYAYTFSRNPKVLGNAYVDMVNCYFILRPYETEYVDRPDLGKTYPDVHTDAYGIGVQEGGWCRTRGCLFMSANSLIDNVAATQLMVGIGGATGRLSNEGSFAENGLTFAVNEDTLITALPYTLAATTVPATGTSREQWVASLWALAGSKVDAAPEGMFTPLHSSTAIPNGETIVLENRLDRGNLLQRVDQQREYSIATAASIKNGSLAQPRGFTRYVGKAGGKSTGANIGPTIMDLTGLTSGYFSTSTPGGAYNLKHIVATDLSITDGLYLEMFGSTSNPITIQNATTKTVTAVDTTADTITATAHGETTSGFVVQLGGTAPPAPLTINTIYYGIYVDANTFKVAASYSDALAGIAIDLTSAGTAPTATFGSFNLPGGTSVVLNSSSSVYEFRFNTANNRFNMVSTTPPVLPIVVSGTYTPTLTAVANCTALSVVKAYYSRNGNIVNATVRVQGTQTAGSTATKFEISLPVASALVIDSDVIGAADTNAPAPAVGYCNGNAATDNAAVGFVSTASAGAVFQLNVMFQYEVK